MYEPSNLKSGEIRLKSWVTEILNPETVAEAAEAERLRLAQLAV